MELIDHKLLDMYMTKRRHTVRSLAQIVRSSHSTIHALRSGKRTVCKGDLGARIEQALRVPEGDLFAVTEAVRGSQTTNRVAA